MFYWKGNAFDMLIRPQQYNEAPYINITLHREPLSEQMLNGKTQTQ